MPKAAQLKAGPLEVALDEELHRFDQLTIQLWRYALSIGVLAGMAVAQFLAWELGVACLVTSLVYLVWFSWLGQHLRRGPASALFDGVRDVIEATVPWVFLAVMTFAQGADYALASWVPPMVFMMLILAHALRLRVRTPILVGLASAITFPLLYFLELRDRLPSELSRSLVFGSGVQVTRALSLALCGVGAALGARYLRQVITRAGVTTRQRELFGKYRLVRSVARGGMGEVFEAVYCPEGGFERRVAVKRIHPHLADSERFVHLFRTEAEICARLAHPNITQVMDFGRVDDSYFLAMEYVDGMTLAVFLREYCQEAKQGLPEDLVGQLGRELLAGLHHAHEVARGADGCPLHVVHRDLCPQNVLLSRNGEVKITDFGVARALKDAGSSYTRTVVGHAGYMAPEQARAESVDVRADLFSLSVILWELLVGRRLFRRENESATLLALMNDPVPPLLELRPGLNPRWNALVTKGLSRTPEERFASAVAMTQALDEIPSSRSTSAAASLGKMVCSLTGKARARTPARSRADVTRSARGGPDSR